MAKVNFKTFIASSISSQKYIDLRSRIADALSSLTNDPALSQFNFGTYRYEENDCATGSQTGAQNDINLNVEDSHAFVLLCDSNVGKKTKAEFDIALERFKQYKNPFFMIILKENVSYQCKENQITYEEFKKQYIKIYNYNKYGEVVDDALIYEVPFDNISDAIEILKTQLKKCVLESNKRPVLKAEFGRNITSDFFYMDKNRRDKCDDNIYFRRRFDDELDKALQTDEHIVLIKGASLSGKTRALYQAIKRIPDALFYKFMEKYHEDNLIEEISEIASIIRISRSNTPLYLIFDDMSFSSDKISSAFKELIEVVEEKNVHIVMISSSFFSDTIKSSYKTVKTIEIPSLSPEECKEAKIFFVRTGILAGAEIKEKYNEIGAMMIDLASIKATYKSFTAYKDYKSIARQCLLKSIKASSIWHQSNIGNVEGLFSFAKDLLNKVSDIKDELLIGAFNDLLSLPGISSTENSDTITLSGFLQLPDFINIEEYIYRYVLDSLSFKEEWELMSQILSYVNYTKEESIIVCLSKLARRAENRNEIADLIYDIVMSKYDENHCVSDRSRKFKFEQNAWYKEELEKEIEIIKTEIRQKDNKSNEECSEGCIYMAKIIWSKMILADSYDEAEKIFKSVPYKLQNLAMVGALILKSNGNKKKLGKILERKDIDKSFYIKNKLIPYASDFNGAYAYFDESNDIFATDSDYITCSEALRTIQRQKEQDECKLKEFRYKETERQNFILAVNSLAGKVRCLDDLNKLLGIIEKNYALFLDNLSLANQYIIQSKSNPGVELTMVDLLSCLSFYGLRSAFTDIFIWGEQISAELLNFLNEILEEFKNSSGIYTKRYKAKQTLSTIFNVFIEKSNNCLYNDVFNNIFLKMHIEHNDKKINLCDSFTYCEMLRIKKCSFMDALNLYERYIEPHSKDPEGHYRITHFVLNEIFNKVKSFTEFEKVNSFFDDNKVTKDIYTYNNILRNMSYDDCVNKILPQMFDEKVEIDIYSLGILISKAPDIKIASGYLWPLIDNNEINTEPKRIDRQDVDGKLMDKVKQLTGGTPLGEQHYLWASLAKSHCRDDDDRSTLEKILEYLKSVESLKDMIENDKGIIYNNCISNSSFIRNYEEAQSFIKKHNITLDSYTLAHLMKIIIDENTECEDYENNAVKNLNILFKENKDLIIKITKKGNTYIYNHRLRVYKSHDSKLSMLFLFQETDEEMYLNPFEYVRYLVEKKLPVDQFTLSNFASIKQGNTFGLLNEFLTLIEGNNLKVNYHTIDYLIKNFEPYIPENERHDIYKRIYSLPVKDNQISQGKSIVKKYSYGLYSIDEAFNEITGNATERLYRYTEIISQYRKSIINAKDSSAVIESCHFNQCMDLYRKYICGKITPNVDLFSNIANFATNKSELDQVFSEMEKFRIKPDPYIITSIMCVSKNKKEVKEFFEKYIRLKGKELGKQDLENAADKIIKGLVNIWEGNVKDKEIHDLLLKLKDYLISEAQSSEVLESFPFFSIYKREGRTLSHDALCQLLKVRPYGEDENNTKSEYLKQAAGLLKKHIISDSEFLKTVLSEFIKNNSLKFDDLKSILKAEPENTDYEMVVLVSMAEKLVKYSDLCFLLERVSKSSVDVSSDLAHKLVFNIVRKRYDYEEFGQVSDQVLTAINEDNLMLKHMLCKMDSSATTSIELSNEEKSKYRLIHSLSDDKIISELSSCEIIARAEELITEYYAKPPYMSLIDSLVVQEFLNCYIKAFKKCSNDDFKAELRGRMKKILDMSETKKIDSSILFSKESRSKLGKKPGWYKITSYYISKNIIKGLL